MSKLGFMVTSYNPLEHIDRLISQVDESHCLEDIKAALELQIKRLGFDKFCYWVIWPPSGLRTSFALSNYPVKWLDHYTNNSYRSDDVVGRFSALCSRPFSWKEVRKKYLLTPAQRRVFDEAGDSGLKSGASVPIHGPGAAVASFSVSNDMDQDEFEKLFLRSRHEIHLMATYAHEKIMSMNFREPAVSGIKLTAREVEIMTWIARGKTRWETAKILNIAEDTVKQHIENACHKLEATNKAHAVAKALSNGLISL